MANLDQNFDLVFDIRILVSSNNHIQSGIIDNLLNIVSDSTRLADFVTTDSALKNVCQCGKDNVDLLRANPNNYVVQQNVYKIIDIIFLCLNYLKNNNLKIVFGGAQPEFLFCHAFDLNINKKRAAIALFDYYVIVTDSRSNISKNCRNILTVNSFLLAIASLQQDPAHYTNYVMLLKQ